MNFTVNVKPASIYNITEEADDKQVLGSVYLVLAVLVMAANGVVIFTIVKTWELHLPTLWVITNMAVWDFLYGLHFLIFAVPSTFLNRFAYSEGLLGLASYLLRLMSSQNMLNIFVVVLDRCFAVRWALKYTNVATKRNYTVLVAATYVLSLTMLCDLHVHYNSETAVSFPNLKSRFQASCPVYVFFVTTLAILLCLILILKEIMLGRRQDVSAGVPLVNLAKPSLMVIWITLAYFAVTLPGSVDFALRSVYKDDKSFSWLTKLFMITVLSNSLWNVFIYTATYRPFREALVAMCCKTHYIRRRQADIQATFRNMGNNSVTTVSI